MASSLLLPRVRHPTTTSKRGPTQNADARPGTPAPNRSASSNARFPSRLPVHAPPRSPSLTGALRRPADDSAAAPGLHRRCVAASRALIADRCRSPRPCRDLAQGPPPSRAGVRESAARAEGCVPLFHCRQAGNRNSCGRSTPLVQSNVPSITATQSMATVIRAIAVIVPRSQRPKRT